MDLDRQPVYIVGAAESPLGEVRDHTELSMAAVAAREALAEAGLGLADVDGLFGHNFGLLPTCELAEYLGIQPRYTDTTEVGGSSFQAFVHHALVALAAERCDVALVAYASRQRSLGRIQIPGDPGSLRGQFEVPCGLPIPIGHYALIAARHMHRYGTTSEQLAEIAVAARRWAALNPRAWLREPLSVADVLASRMLADPLHKLDCCLITDGGGAIVLTRRDRARDAARRPVRVIGAGESCTHWHITQMPDLTETAAVVSGREAFAMAGIGPADVDFIEPYDSFTITVLIALEDLGFCAKGEGGPFVQGGRLAPGGALPAMTSGGGLSYNHPGELGLLLLIEAVRQIRGEAGERQLERHRIGVTHGVGGMMSSAGTVVLARE